MSTEETKTAHGMVTLDEMTCSSLVWLRIITFFYDGEPYEYTCHVGRAWMTEDEAHHHSRVQRHMDRAQKQFIEEVQLTGAAH
jgi:hypothetical protein